MSVPNDSLLFALNFNDPRLRQLSVLTDHLRLVYGLLITGLRHHERHCKTALHQRSLRASRQRTVLRVLNTHVLHATAQGLQLLLLL